MMRRCIALILALAVCMGIFSACMNEDSYPPALELSAAQAGRGNACPGRI